MDRVAGGKEVLVKEVEEATATEGCNRRDSLRALEQADAPSSTGGRSNCSGPRYQSSWHNRSLENQQSLRSPLLRTCVAEVPVAAVRWAEIAEVRVVVEVLMVA